MNKLRLYLDTSVISYLDQQDVPEKMKITQKFWESLKSSKKYQILISDTTIEELEQCNQEKKNILLNYLAEIDYIHLHFNESIEETAEKIIAKRILPPKSIQDRLHIAYALEGNCDYILSWNFKHLINTRARNGVRDLSLILGYKAPDLVSPEEFYESEIVE